MRKVEEKEARRQTAPGRARARCLVAAAVKCQPTGGITSFSETWHSGMSPCARVM